MSDEKLKPVQVLILHRAGELLVYGTKHVKPTILNVPHTGSAAGDVALEKLLDELLPRSICEVYFPGNLLATAWLLYHNAESFADRVSSVKLQSELESLRPLTWREAIVLALKS